MKSTPLFLLSLPRSGSTLAQRFLAAHDAIATASEPWILLPYFYTLRACVGPSGTVGPQGGIRALRRYLRRRRRDGGRKRRLSPLSVRPSARDPGAAGGSLP
ncbi:MAG: sulfotransferase [Rubrobacteraceae bacterium]|nr:sulfotransferase [Rubrobacteraceae bacterium]